MCLKHTGSAWKAAPLTTAATSPLSPTFDYVGTGHWVPVTSLVGCPLLWAVTALTNTCSCDLVFRHSTCSWSLCLTTLHWFRSSNATQVLYASTLSVVVLQTIDLLVGCQGYVMNMIIPIRGGVSTCVHACMGPEG
jgi:hypothetical protein